MPMDVVYTALFALVLVYFLFLRARPDIDGPDARRRVASGAKLVDVRSHGEFAGGHIEGADNVPVDQLARRLAELPKEKDLIVYCASGMRSSRAAKVLRAAGFRKVYDLGGMSRW